MLYSITQTEREALVSALKVALRTPGADLDTLLPLAGKLVGPFDSMTGEESVKAFGPSWGICRATPANKARYGRCITQAEYAKAEHAALRARGLLLAA